MGLQPKFYLFTVLIFIISFNVRSQGRLQDLRTHLEILKADNPNLDNLVELSVNGSSLTETIRGLANTNNLNISVDDQIDTKITNNFSNVTVSEVLLFLAKEYGLDMEFTGSIISIRKYLPKVEEIPEEGLKVSYFKSTDRLSLDLEKEDLREVLKEITKVSGRNIILSPEIPNQRISIYLKDVPFDLALSNFAFANKMKMEVESDGIYRLSEFKREKMIQNPAKVPEAKKPYEREKAAGLYLEENAGMLDVAAEDITIDELFKAAAAELKINYYLPSSLQGTKTLNLKGIDFETFLDDLFESTIYTYSKTNGVYLIGERKSEGLRKTLVFQMQNRSISEFLNFIPNDLTNDVELKEFADLNSLVISGSYPQIQELVSFLERVDQVVPVIAIEVIIVDYRKNRSVSAGIRAGLGTEPSGSTSGQIFPNTQFNFSSQSLNNVIGNINEGSTINLGKVTPNFYLSIQALETDGILKVRSTPKLATLNGHEAELKIGNTEYYINEQSIFQGTLGAQTQNNRIFVPVTADLSVKIKPIVSGNDQITMEIAVEQSDFTERITEDAPPGKVTRSFTSMLRVKDNEIILLGGLEEKSLNNSGSGLPLLARIPIIKWIFGNRTRAKNSSQLNVFIKPTVIY